MHIPYVFDCRICQSIDMIWSSAVLAILFLLGDNWTGTGQLSACLELSC